MTTKENHEKVLATFDPIIQNYLKKIVSRATFMGQECVYLADYSDMGGYSPKSSSEVSFVGKDKIEEGTELYENLLDAMWDYKNKITKLGKDNYFFVDIV